MTRRLAISSGFALMLAVVWCLSTSQTSAQQAPAAKAQAPAAKQAASVDEHGQKARGSGDNDPNVKTKPGLNDPAKKAVAPPSKGGPKTRGTSCVVVFDNYTQWQIEAYVDGEYWGVLPRYGELYTVAGNGRTQLYARARFTDGSTTTWGPRYFECQNQPFTWKLYE